MLKVVFLLLLEVWIEIDITCFPGFGDLDGSGGAKPF